MSLQQVDGLQGLCTPCIIEGGLVSLNDEQSVEFNRLFLHILKCQQRSAINDFFTQAKVKQLNGEAFHKYLNCLEAAFIISSRDKCKQLFIHACALNRGEWGEQFLEKGSIAPYQLLIELLSLENIPKEAVQQLARKGIDLKPVDATTPNVHLLISQGVPPNSITMNSKPVVEWAAAECPNESLFFMLFSQMPIYSFQVIMNSDSAEVRQVIINPLLVCLYLPLSEIIPVLKHVRPSTELLQFIDLLAFPSDFLSTPEADELFNQLLRLEAESAQRNMLSAGYKMGPALLSQLVEAKRFDFIGSLIKERILDPNVKTKEGNPLLFWASEIEDTSLFNLLLDHQVNIMATGQSQQTLLHFAVIRNHLGVVRWCLTKGFNVNALDIHKCPPLYYALTPRQPLLPRFIQDRRSPEFAQELLLAGANPFFLGDRLALYAIFIAPRYALVLKNFEICKCYAQNPSITFAQHLKEKSVTRPREALEMYFLLARPDIAFLVMSHFKTKEAALAALNELHHKYPQAPIEYFYPFLLSVNTAHTERKPVDFTIPQINQPVDLKELLTNFDQLNWDAANAPGYCDLTQVRKTQLHDSMKTLLLNHIPTRSVFTGVPRNNPERENFYKNLENVYKNIILQLREQRDPAQRKKRVLKIAKSAMGCGTAWETVAQRGYHKLKTQKSGGELIEDKYNQELISLRENIARSIGHGSPHGYRMVVRSVKALAMGGGLTEMVEPAESYFKHLTPPYCNHMFHYTYSVELLVTETLSFFEKYIKQSNGDLIKWFKTHMPEDFDFPEYRQLSLAVSSLPLFLPKAPDQQAAFLRLCKKITGIPPSNKEAQAKDVLQEYREIEYIDRSVFDTENVRILMDGVIHFMKQHGVINESYKGIFKDFIEMWNKPPEMNGSQKRSAKDDLTNESPKKYQSTKDKDTIELIYD